MSTTTQYRCYYDDGSIITVTDYCPLYNQNNSPLLKSEATIIQDVIETIQFPWFLIIVGLLLVFTSKKGK